jgi:hypothetical protein
VASTACPEGGAVLLCLSGQDQSEKRPAHPGSRLALKGDRRERETGQFLHQTPCRTRPPFSWKRHPAGWKHPAACRTRNPAGFSVRRLAGRVHRSVGSVTRQVGSIRRLAGRGTRSVSPSNVSPDGSTVRSEASPGMLEASGGSPDAEPGRFLSPTPHRTGPPFGRKRHPAGWKHPAAREPELG